LRPRRGAAKQSRRINVSASEQRRPELSAEQRAILDAIRALWVESGGQISNPTRYELNRYDASTSEHVEVLFDYGVPKVFRTPRGETYIGASGANVAAAPFWEKLTGRFNVEILKPQRNEAKTSYLDRQLDYSGPLMTVREKV
jgi:hypothetical protein